MKEDEILLVNQLVNTLERAIKKLEDYYEKKDQENFNKTKRLILQIQRKIWETAR